MFNLLSEFESCLVKKCKYNSTLFDNIINIIPLIKIKLMLPQKIEDRTKRINIKSKRRKNLFKKAFEIGFKCDLEVLLILKDTEFRKYTVYNSSMDCFDTLDVERLFKESGSNQKGNHAN